MTRTIDEVDADLQAFKTQVPTLEEQLVSLVIDAWPNSSGTPTTLMAVGYAATLMVAPIALKILSVAVSFEYWSLTADDTSYWQCDLKRWTGSGTILATKATQVTGANANGGVTARTAWAFDSAPFADLTFNAGDLLIATWNPHGTVAQQKLPATYTIRYRPV